MGRPGVWTPPIGLLALACAVILACIGCSEPCAEVADLLRKCCAKGPADLRASCEAEAKRLEDDPNSDACEHDLDFHVYDGCAQ